MIEALDTGHRLTCNGYYRRDSSWFEFMLVSKNPLAITYDIDDTISNTTPKGIHFCLGAHYEFSTYSGKPARHTKLPDGSSGYVGLLPACTTTTSASQPCVVSIKTAKNRKSSTGINTILIVQVPATAGSDPWAGG